MNSVIKINSIIIVLTMLLGMMAPTSMASTETEEVIIYGSDARTLSSQLLLDTKADSETGYETARRFATTNGAALPEEGVYVTYKFNVPLDGIYRLDMIAGKYDHGYISTYSVKVDDKEYSAINATTIQSSNATTSALLMEYTTNLYYNLKAGTHTFYFKPDYCTAQSRVYSFLNKASFVKATDSEIAQLSQISIEGRDAYTTNSSEFPNYTLNIYGDNSANDYRQGTTSIKISGSGAADNFPQNGIVISYEFDVMKDGIYELSSLTAGDVAHTHLSKYGISIDGGIVKKVYSASIESTTAHSTYDLLKVYTTNLRYYLTEGRHKFNFVIYEHNTARNGTYTYFDKATLNLIENPEDYNSVIYGQDLYVEKTSDLTVSLSRADMASNGKMVAFTAPVGTTVPKSIKYKFEIYDDGEYTLDLVSGYCDLLYLSEYSIKIDGGAEIPITADALLSMTGNSESEHAMNAALKNVFELKRGIHTFEIIITSVRDKDESQVRDDDLLVFFEKAEFSKVENLGRVDVALTDKYVDVDGVYNYTIADVKAYGDVTGKELSLDSATTYFTSSDSNIATVDDWGIVTAVSKGKAIITANVTIDGISKSASVPVYITKNNQAVYSVGFFSNDNPINEITTEMDNLTAKAVFYNGTGETIKDITIYAAVYDGGRLVYCNIANYPELTVGEHELSATLERLELTDTCTAKMFVWNSEQCPQMNADGI